MEAPLGDSCNRTFQTGGVGHRFIGSIYTRAFLDDSKRDLSELWLTTRDEKGVL